ncbi:hypothetical protein KAU43_01350 [candidate division WOR-3 bacterium]|nr:hypothetical protein [candidate division WOR-3 bacterium]
MYSLPIGGNVEIVIYNVLGQKVRTLVTVIGIVVIIGYYGIKKTIGVGK